ncbi:MAG TPA: AsmA family protein [Woeseiaceae bacterium]|nr:AsmA family protein [Woeseiaceae bacterium]
MGRFVKYILIAVAVLVVVLLVAVVAFFLLFDPNDYRDRIATEVKTATGRDLVIEGDLGVKLFPWLAIELGRTELGNAEGFGAEPFASFDSAKLSVRVVPLLLHREVLIGTAELTGLDLNLAVNKSGRSNWQDLLEREDAVAGAAPADSAAGPAALDIGSIRVAGANLSYDDAQLGDHYQLRDLDISSGSVRAEQPIDLEGSFSFSAKPADISGDVEFRATASFAADAVVELSAVVLDAKLNGVIDGGVVVPVSFKAPLIRLATEQQRAEMGELELKVLDLDIKATVEPFSYASDPMPVATIDVAAFAPKSLMQSLKIEVPEMADPNALGKLRMDGKAKMTTDSVQLTGLTLVLDDTTFKGELSAPLGDGGLYRMKLAGDHINLDRYMAPTNEDAAAAAAGEEPPLEIPVELIRSLDAQASLTIAEVLLAGMQFADVEVGINNRNDKLRINPFTATFFDGSYQGDIQIDATGDVATLSVNEKIQDVSLAPLAKTLFEQDNITGLVNGNFVLSGRGNNMNDVQRNLNGNVSFTLKDGAYEGTDLWYELRRARALLKQEPAPAATLPARTPFSTVSATGKVTNGVMQNDDFLAELPFMQLQGKGSVNLVSSKVDYALSARVFDRPELVSKATPAEIADLTKVVVPLRITGTLTEPKIGVDLADAAKARVADELKSRLLEKLDDGGEENADGEEKEKDAKDLLKDKLKDLLKR